MAGKFVDSSLIGCLTGLLRLALGLSEDSRAVPHIGDKEWTALLELARRQTVGGLLESAIRKLPESRMPDQSVLVNVMMEAERTARRSSAVEKAARSLLEQAEAQGLHPVLMKGPAVARDYPHPELRTSGDIDLYIPETQLQGLLDFLQRKGGVVEKTPDGSHFVKGAVDIDIHTAYFDLHYPPASLPEPGSPEAELLMLSSHILKHAMGPGVGLRQLCDMAMAIRALEGRYNAEALTDYFRKTGTLHWNQVLDAFLQRHFRLQWGLFRKPFSKTVYRDARYLEKIVFSGGNFGHFQEGRSKALGAPALIRKADTAFRFLQRLPFSVRCASREYGRYLRSLVSGNMG